MHFSDTCEVNVALCNIRLHHENTLYSKELLYECSHEKRGLAVWKADVAQSSMLRE